MNGAGEFAHLDLNYRRFVALSDEERIAWITCRLRSGCARVCFRCSVPIASVFSQAGEGRGRVVQTRHSDVSAAGRADLQW